MWSAQAVVVLLKFSTQTPWKSSMEDGCNKSAFFPSYFHKKKIILKDYVKECYLDFKVKS